LFSAETQPLQALPGPFVYVTPDTVFSIKNVGFQPFSNHYNSLGVAKVSQNCGVCGSIPSHCLASEISRARAIASRSYYDGSIEHETSSGTNWFRSLAELERSLRASNNIQQPRGTDGIGSQDANGPVAVAGNPTATVICRGQLLDHPCLLRSTIQAKIAPHPALEAGKCG
jgi:hypothetical protein